MMAHGTLYARDLGMADAPLAVDAIDRRLIDGFQHGFPLVAEPFDAIGAVLGIDTDAVLVRLARLMASGALSRVGIVLRPNSVGASTLAAIAVPPREVERAAMILATDPAVNHAYEREHRYNLWFVVACGDRAGVDQALARIEHATGAAVLALPLLREFHIDLGFPLFGPRTRASEAAVAAVDRPVTPEDRRLLTALDDGLPLEPRPYAAVARQLGLCEEDVIARLSALAAAGIIKRIGLVLRHRAFGYRANAMVVWDVADNAVESTARRFIAHDFVTLCYERPRRPPLWRYNLFTMIHGRDRATVVAEIANLAGGVDTVRNHDVLFSTRCFRQCGARLSAA